MKRLISLLITVLLALPALTTVAYEGDLYFYDFNNYTGQNIFTCSGTDLQPTIIGETQEVSPEATQKELADEKVRTVQ